MEVDEYAEAGRSRRMFALICSLVGLLFLAVFIGGETLFSWSFVEKTELAGARWIIGAGRSAEVRDDLVFVGVDNVSLNLLEVGPLADEEIAASPALDFMAYGYPYPRQVWGLLAERLLEAGARMVVFDLIFATEGEGDERLKAALDAYPKGMVIGADLSGSEGRQSGYSWSMIEPVTSILDPGGAGDLRQGYVNYFPLDDGRVWEFVPRHRLVNDPTAPEYLSLVCSVLHQIGEPALEPRGARVGIRFPELDIDGAAGEVIPYEALPLYTIFHEDSWKRNYGNGSFFEGKIVMVGGSSIVRFQDELEASVGLVAGPKVHLSVLANALDDDFFAFAPVSVRALLIVLAAVAAFGVALLMRHPLVGIGVLFGGSAFYAFAAVMVFNAGMLLNFVAPVGTFLISGILCFGAQYTAEQVEKRRMKRVLDRYFSKELTDEIMANPAMFLDALGGRRLEATVLFSDLRDFTTKSEGVDERELVAQLNEYLEEMVSCVFAHGGMVDKFIGDAVMAVWGAVKSAGPKGDAGGAVGAALAMRERLAALNKKWAAEGRPAHSFGIGINRGTAIFGNIGSEEKMELTVIGDAVNLASRIEGLTKRFGIDLLVSESVADSVTDEVLLRSIATVVPKGKTVEVGLFAVPGRSRGELSEDDAEFLALYHKAHAAWCDADPERAAELFARCAEMRPDDRTVAIYCERLREAAGDPAAMREAMRITEK